MNESGDKDGQIINSNSPLTITESDIKSKRISRCRKRKRLENSSSSESESMLPENALEMEKNLHASAIKNNLDDASVKKILKKVVTNDHVLALVKLREEEEESSTEENIRPKLTRAKVKELMKVSPKNAPWSLELTPIKHIPIKTRPEVKALIAQELPDDEDDDEYEPTHEDLPSDDDHTLESCSDVDSMPPTPATPRRQTATSPGVIKDGPFKVPQEVATPTRRRPTSQERATIALRTRSKLSLSATPIEHIEGSFVPPDDVPAPDAEDPVWNEFLEGCLNPAHSARNEDDDDADPEYNVAADPDANDEDEALENNIIRISKKELNDLVTELFSIMPEATVEDELAADLANKVLSENNTENNAVLENTQEPMSDEEDTSNVQRTRSKNVQQKPTNAEKEPRKKPKQQKKPTTKKVNSRRGVRARGEERDGSESPPPPPVLRAMSDSSRTELSPEPPLVVHLTDVPELLPEQILILQQQLRQHIQLSASNFLQLFAHPDYWNFAHKYKEYLTVLNDLAKAKPNSVANVCNLKPALDLIASWESSTSEPTPENNEMVEFVKKQMERSRNRTAQKNLYVGDFHNTLMDVVANSTVFLYPYLLPAMPFRDEPGRRFRFLRVEDQLIAHGLDEFWRYVDMNPKLYKSHYKGPARCGLRVATRLLCRHMMPWFAPHSLLAHVFYVRRNDKENPIYKFFESRKVDPVKHVLLPYNEKLTLYEQPEYEMPRIWVRHLAKSSQRFKDYMYRRTNVTGVRPQGVEISVGETAKSLEKKPLPIKFFKAAKKSKQNPCPQSPPAVSDKVDVQVKNAADLQPTILYGDDRNTRTVNSASEPICSTTERSEPAANEENRAGSTAAIINSGPEKSESSGALSQSANCAGPHCGCCVMLRRICKERQKLITEYFGPRPYRTAAVCPCGGVDRPRLGTGLRLLLRHYKSRAMYVHNDTRLRHAQCDENAADFDYANIPKDCVTELDDAGDTNDSAFVTYFTQKLLIRLAIVRNHETKKRVYSLFSKFDHLEGDVVQLATSLEKLFDVELVDMFKEFLRFLTPEQADKINKFKDYFTQACVSDLVKRISVEVTDKSKKQALLARLITSFTDNKSTPCQICSDLLSYMGDNKELAKYTFNLFPHSRVAGGTCHPIVTQSVNTPQNPPPDESDHEEATLRICEEAEVGLSSNDDRNAREEQPTDEFPKSPKVEVPEEEIDEMTEGHLQESESNKKFSNEDNIKVESDDESVKSETSEWLRSEDKLILEILKNRLTREERQNKTILDIFEEKEVMQMITDSLSHKSNKDVTDRVMYLLELLVLSEN
ncbi:unnamed protein product, partial [Iphiclides podalirius]